MGLGRIPGSLLFAAGAVLLVVQGEMGVVTLMGAVAAAVCAVLALSRRHLWAMVGGVMMISLSVTMQISMGYWCEICLRADMMLLAAVIALALVQKGRVRIPSRIMAGTVSLVLIAVMIMVTPGSMKASSVIFSEDAWEEIAVLAEEKPVLLFSPNCDACDSVITRLMEHDPEGVGWLAVQSGGLPEEGQSYLIDKGYQGAEVLYHKVPTAVPALAIVQQGQVQIVRGEEAILESFLHHATCTHKN